MDILEKLPQKKKNCMPILNKSIMSTMDIIKLNKLIFGINRESEKENQKHRSYVETDILHILDYQTKHKLTNTSLAQVFKLSRNTVAKWKRIYIHQAKKS
ncbi:helix-turn-helix domain-containing protein [Chryseobacterium pennae]|nr:helix-turn-helix domain-containing protein [Chryseobacterium pennae]